MSDVISSILGITLQATGNNNNNWGNTLNGSALQPLEKAIAGVTSHAVTGGTLDLSGSPPPAAQTQMLEMMQVFTGVLTSNQLVKVPNVSKSWLICNSTSGAFQLLLQVGSGAIINIPQNTNKMVFCDGGGGLVRLDKDQVGDFVYNTTLKPGVLACNGASVLKADFPDLYLDVGTTYGSVDSLHFTLPLLTDTNRYLRAAGGSLAVGTYQANQNLAHTHAGASFSGTTGSENSDHTHVGSGTTASENAAHSHTTTGTSDGFSGAGPFTSNSSHQTTNSGGTSGTESANHGHTYSFTTSGISTVHQHTYSGTTGTIPSSGGTEARPESLAVIIGIRY